MSPSQTHKQHVTLVITHKIAPASEAQYEAWLNKIMPQASTFPGHLGVNVIRPSRSGDAYTILVRFDTLENLNAWHNSDLRKQLVAEVSPLLLQNDNTEVRPGAEFWFTPPNANVRPPARWKQYLLTLGVIYPSTHLVPWFWGQFLPQLKGTEGGHLLNDATVVGLVVFLWMPIVTRVFHSWLTRSSAQ
ncbi:antibiotic biosynthesis monooxygenase [Rahnella aquatilis CIP 78.65 = ATCC 33071]|uniref:ABM domain-containing protein n=1 Tax=Rahnella aquatilis (strain ATCC 33071 / DSM 4594 / JCM 1683 / NBRC 105701 / NCIMB 13365 / CIP 78.65) TaxID=745277 RepID=H2J1B9_RAHAC|nr:antibiotic biosynthesis monooxygenase [Rahnella aquatilis]AEX54366.1 hypothetical protein Rahaq2_4639 [Rahnella aquatilis CIP 78.65 = ATCC 33071]KFC99741.1 antibiotic biosynthesis monooxygenase [Rahnella aquatilis CIP 78.65 = ATCC 33071]